MKFALAPFITKELTEQVSQAAGFVTMLDESLNKTVGNPSVLLGW